MNTEATMQCRRCDKGMHPQHAPRCPDCHHGRGLCFRCYDHVTRAGHLDDYPRMQRRDGVVVDCPHGGKHAHGTPEAYVQDGCGCTHCRAAKARQNADHLKRVYLTGGPMCVDSTGTVRRIRALMRLGWTAAAIAEAGAVSSARAVQLLPRRTKVLRETADGVAAAYDRLSMRVGPSGTTRRRAERAGWPPPLAWADESIDDPAAVPHADDEAAGEVVDEIAVARFVDGDHDLRLNQVERVHAARRLLGRGWSNNQVQKAMRVNGTTWARIRAAAKHDEGEAAA